MRIDQLPRGMFRENLRGYEKYCPIVILQKTDGTHTWRGVGQRLPNNVILLGIGHILFRRYGGSDDLRENRPDEFVPIELSCGFGSRELSFDDHCIGVRLSSKLIQGVAFVGSRKGERKQETNDAGLADSEAQDDELYQLSLEPPDEIVTDGCDSSDIDCCKAERRQQDFEDSQQDPE